MSANKSPINFDFGLLRPIATSGHYPEPHGRAQFVVLGCEVGERWSEESRQFLPGFAETKARSEPEVMKKSTMQSGKGLCFVVARAQVLHCSRWLHFFDRERSLLGGKLVTQSDFVSSPTSLKKEKTKKNRIGPSRASSCFQPFPLLCVFHLHFCVFFHLSPPFCVFSNSTFVCFSHLSFCVMQRVFRTMTTMCRGEPY